MNSLVQKSHLLKKLTVIFVAAVFINLVFVHQAGSNTAEIRAVWMHLESQFDADPEKGKQDIEQFVNQLADANINLILPWVRSEYVAALTDEAYQKQVPIAKWDALGELVKAAHEKGLQVQIWYSFTYYKSPASPDFNSQHGGNPEWAARQMDELFADPATGKVRPRKMRNICPLHYDARKWQLNLLEMLLDRYPLVSGVHIEEPGYSGKGNCVCDLCIKVFKLVYGYDLTTDINGEEAEDLRCTGTTEFMRQLHKRLIKKNSKAVLSTNGAWSWRSDRHSGRNWKHWAQVGWLRFYAPQVYTSDMGVFKSRTQATITDLGKDCPVAIGIAVRWGGGKNSVETVINQVETARKLGAQGIVFFHGKALTNELLQELKAGPFKERVDPF